ncbi:WD40 repeat protein [Giardia muris]|uniref:WD40 repeat protein n=1 Tax=Giardia muris TaxID=5742 RepID=A0A4Z1SNZ1_GIAMU|nr:WD40 repeat protein [Giardia muris]|eukprot:TNJ27544.1 WD40 repeat protein [Giardia muris]
MRHFKKYVEAASNAAGVATEAAPVLVRATSPGTRFTCLATPSGGPSLFLGTTEPSFLEITMAQTLASRPVASVPTALEPLTWDVVAMGRLDGRLQLWDCRQDMTGFKFPLLGTGPKVRERHASAITMAVRVGAWGLATGAEDGAVFIWDLRYLARPFLQLRSHGAAITGLISLGEVLISTSLDGSHKLWELVRGGLLHTRSDLVAPLPIYETAYSGGDEILSLEGEFLRTFQVKAEIVHTRTLYHATEPFTSMAVSGEGYLALGGPQSITIFSGSAPFRPQRRIPRRTGLDMSIEPHTIMGYCGDVLLYSDLGEMRLFLAEGCSETEPPV